MDRTKNTSDAIRGLADYADAHLPHHLLTGGYYPHLLFLLGDPGFLAAKLTATNPDDLLGDLRAARDGIPDTIDSSIPADRIAGLRTQLADNLRLFSREGLKFLDPDVAAHPVAFWHRYLYGIQRWRLGSLAEHERTGLGDVNRPVWSLRWLADSEGDALEEVRSFAGANAFALSADGRHLLVARPESVDIFKLDTWSQKDSIPFADATEVAAIPGGRSILLAQSQGCEIWDLFPARCLRKVSGPTPGAVAFATARPNPLAFFASESQITRLDPDSGRVDLWSSGSRITAWCPTPDGTRVVVGDIDHTVKLIDVGETATALELGTHDDVVTALAVTPDGRVALSGSQDGRIKVWDLSRGTFAHELEPSAFPVYRLLVDPAGRHVVAASIPYGTWGKMSRKETPGAPPENVQILTGFQKDMPTEIRVWRVADRRLLGRFPNANSEVDAIRFSPSGRHLLLGYVSGAFEIWEFTSSSLQALEPVSDRSAAQASAPTTNQIVSKSVLQCLLLVVAGMIVMSIVRGLSFWSGVAVTLTGPVLASVLHASASVLAVLIERRFRTRRGVSRDELTRTARISVWLTAVVILGLCIAAPWIGTGLSYLGVAGAPALGSLIAAEIPKRRPPPPAQTGQTASPSPQRFGGHGSSVSWLQVTADERRVVSASQEDSQLKVWELSDPDAEVRSVGHEAEVVAIEPIPGRPQIATAGMDGCLKIWNLESGASVASCNGHQRKVTAVSVTADGVRALSASKDEQVIVWNLSEGRPELIFRRHKAIVTDVRALSGGRAVSVDLAGVLLIWNVATGDVELRHEFADEQNRISRLGVAPDESFIVGIPRGALAIYKTIGETVNLDYPATPVIDLDGRLLTKLPWMECLRFLTTPADLLFFAGRRIRRLDLETRETVSLDGHEDDVLDTVVTPDGKRAVSIGRDRTIRCWALDEGRLTQTWIGRTEPTVVAISPDGRILAAGASDRKIRALRLDDLSELAVVTIDGIPRRLTFVEPSNRAPTGWLAVGDDAGRVYCFDYVSSS